MKSEKRSQRKAMKIYRIIFKSYFKKAPNKELQNYESYNKIITEFKLYSKTIDSLN